MENHQAYGRYIQIYLYLPMIFFMAYQILSTNVHILLGGKHHLAPSRPPSPDRAVPPTHRHPSGRPHADGPWPKKSPGFKRILGRENDLIPGRDG